MRVNYSQGSLETTGLTLDLGIFGHGFFVAEDPEDGAEVTLVMDRSVLMIKDK